MLSYYEELDMSTRDEINKAVSAHGQWKQKLRAAIETGQCESTPDKVKMDSNCSFGKWLHRRIDPSAKQTEHYPIVVDLHAKFHKEAGHILALALTGKTELANEKLGLGSEFSKISSQLTQAMQHWHDST